MLHNVRDNYIISVKDHVSQFEEKSFRKLASNDFKSWPSPRDETWRLIRLGVLSRKEITPIKPNFKKQNSYVSKFNGSSASTVSPSFFNHLETVASVILSPKTGTTIFSLIIFIQKLF